MIPIRTPPPPPTSIVTRHQRLKLGGRITRVTSPQHTTQRTQRNYFPSFGDRILMTRVRLFVVPAAILLVCSIICLLPVSASSSRHGSPRAHPDGPAPHHAGEGESRLIDDHRLPWKERTAISHRLIQQVNTNHSAPWTAGQR